MIKRLRSRQQRQEREQRISQHKSASDNGKAALDKLRGKGFGEGQGSPPSQASGQDVQKLMDYTESLEERIAALEAALNLDINPC